MSFSRIFVALDESQLSDTVFRHAMELADTSQSQLMLFHCMDPEIAGEPIIPVPIEVGLYPDLVESAHKNQQDWLQKQTEHIRLWLQKMSEEASKRGISTELDFKIDEAGPGICRAAKAWNADAIVVGRRGRRGLAEVLLGSVSNYVVHNAHCSVLVIQTGESSDRSETASQANQEETATPSQ
ncbi:universal stress protein [Geitlerinema sp. PCC 9228]|jgi:nucleotide-binding universal stress UspA family protein|uniref:universal stress protein n=1 Tax=Geitlerinema sp. PCC 9228 TaxID=111611 RepID=UPI0008F9B0ED|nr:universal stress protein [Geitlerinema sp. PCC 9228]